MIEINNILLANGAVAALVGTRIYPLKLRQAATMPAITYSTIAGGDDVTHDGARGLADLTVQVDCWGLTYLQMDGLFNAVLAALLGYSSATVQGIFLVRRMDMYENESELYRRTADYGVWFKEL